MDWQNNGDDNSNATVFSMSDIKDRIRNAPLAQIEAYWNSLRGTRLMPQRSEIDPRGLRGCLEHCFVLERIAPGLARMRVAGSHLGDLMGMEVRGMPISAFLTAESREAFAKSLEEVFESPAVAEVELIAESGFGRPEMTGRLILMPVRSDLGDVSRILGGFVTEGTLGRAPRRFKVRDIKIKAIQGVDTTPRTGRIRLARDTFRDHEKTSPLHPEAEVARADAPAGFAERPGEFRQALPGVPYLRVVD